MTRMLAGLGGFLCRKGDGEPGVKTVWRGYKKIILKRLMLLEDKYMYKAEMLRYVIKS